MNTRIPTKDSSFNDNDSPFSNVHDATPTESSLKEAFKLLLKEGDQISPKGCHSRMLVGLHRGKKMLGYRVETLLEAKTGVFATYQPPTEFHPGMFYRWVRAPLVLLD